MSEALNHIKVIDLTAARAGPACVRILADMGADVVQVTRPSGESIDQSFASSDRENLHRNKRSLALDLQNDAGRAALLRLVEKADVVVENFRPDVKHRLGVDYEACSAVNPRIVYGSISGFGQDGPYGPRPGVDQIAQGMSGLMSVTGPPGTGPWRFGTAICDLTAGMFLAHGIMGALLEREKSGKGQWVQTSLLEAGVAIMDFQAARWLISKEVPGQAGNDHPTIFPTGTFETADGIVNIAASRNEQYRNFVITLGLPELADDPRFASTRSRGQNRDALRALVVPAFKKKGTAEWVEALNAAGVPCGPIYDVEQVFADPQVRHLGLAGDVHSPAFGPLKVVRSPFGLSRTPPTLRTAAPASGEHSSEVLREAGFSADEIASLVSSGVTSA